MNKRERGRRISSWVIRSRAETGAIYGLGGAYLTVWRRVARPPPRGVDGGPEGDGGIGGAKRGGRRADADANRDGLGRLRRSTNHERIPTHRRATRTARGARTKRQERTRDEGRRKRGETDERATLLGDGTGASEDGARIEADARAAGGGRREWNEGSAARPATEAGNRCAPRNCKLPGCTVNLTVGRKLRRGPTLAATPAETCRALFPPCRFTVAGLWSRAAASSPYRWTYKPPVQPHLHLFGLNRRLPSPLAHRHQLVTLPRPHPPAHPLFALLPTMWTNACDDATRDGTRLAGPSSVACRRVPPVL